MDLARRVKSLIPVSARSRFAPIVYRKDLSRLAEYYWTDKWGQHWYMQHYQRYFAPLRTARINLLEIGVGGYDNIKSGARSLRVWKRFFPNARIVGIDIYDKTELNEPRIDIRVCDQTDGAALKRLSDEYGGFDIIIDDGSHINEHVMKTFQVLFPLLRDNGIYAIEDTQTSYWPSYGGGLERTDTQMAFFKNLTDGLNYVEYPIEEYVPSYFDRNIVEIAFFHNLVIIRKGSNTEPASSPDLVRDEIESLQREVIQESQCQGHTTPASSFLQETRPALHERVFLSERNVPRRSPCVNRAER